jgi:hypothetical protein
LIPINAPPAEDCTLEAMRTQACANQCMDFKGLLFAQPSIYWEDSSAMRSFSQMRLLTEGTPIFVLTLLSQSSGLAHMPINRRKSEQPGPERTQPTVRRNYEKVSACFDTPWPVAIFSYASTAFSKSGKTIRLIRS